MGVVQEVVKFFEGYGVVVDFWSVISYKELYQEVLMVQCYNMLYFIEELQVSYVVVQFNEENVFGVLILVSDYVKFGVDGFNGYFDCKLWIFGIDGFGCSEVCEELCDFFEVDIKYVVLVIFYVLQQCGEVKGEVVVKVIVDFGIDFSKFVFVLC